MDSDMTREQAEHLIVASRPAPGRQILTSALSFCVLIVLILMTLGRTPFPDSPWLALAIPWTLVVGMLALRWHAGRRRRETLRQVSQVVEAAEFSNWERVAQLTRAILAHSVAPESARVQAMLLLAGANDR